LFTRTRPHASPHIFLELGTGNKNTMTDVELPQTSETELKILCLKVQFVLMVDIELVVSHKNTILSKQTFIYREFGPIM
jgi:hypothetical protein